MIEKGKRTIDPPNTGRDNASLRVSPSIEPSASHRSANRENFRTDVRKFPRYCRGGGRDRDIGRMIEIVVDVRSKPQRERTSTLSPKAALIVKLLQRIYVDTLGMIHQCDRKLRGIFATHLNSTIILKLLFRIPKLNKFSKDT